MPQEQFPTRPLNRPLDINGTADPKDVVDVKTYLQKAGFYKTPDYGITPYPDKNLFKAIEKYQASRGLKVDGVMKANGETQESMRIEREKLPTPTKMIPNTNIPDRSVPEQGLDPESYDLYQKMIFGYLSNLDPHIQRPVQENTIDPYIFIAPSDPKAPNIAPKQRSKRAPRGT